MDGKGKASKYRNCSDQPSNPLAVAGKSGPLSSSVHTYVSGMEGTTETISVGVLVLVGIGGCVR